MMRYDLAKRALAFIAVSAIVGHPAAGKATYSVLLADTGTKQLGYAAASCVPFAIAKFFTIVPERGVLAAQGYPDDNARAQAARLIREGRAPLDILSTVRRVDSDSRSELRQYGVVDLNGRSAVYTGRQVDAWAGAREGRVGSLVYAIQGNFLSSQAVIAQVERRLQEAASSSQSMAERLLEALEAGAANGQGDSRCRAYGIPATAAALQTWGPDKNTSLVQLSVLVRTGASAIAQLRQDFEKLKIQRERAVTWRWTVMLAIIGSLAALAFGLRSALRRTRETRDRRHSR